MHIGKIPKAEGKMENTKDHKCTAVLPWEYCETCYKKLEKEREEVNVRNRGGRYTQVAV